jgi:hypothetical protein
MRCHAWRRIFKDLSPFRKSFHLMLSCGNILYGMTLVIVVSEAEVDKMLAADV